MAVLGVLLFHDGRLAGGYLGVDLFFVLSGFLITANLLAEHAASGRIDLRAFWVRRARRLFPALLALVFLVGATAPLLVPAASRARIVADGLATLAYVANWHAIFSGQSYWDLFAAPSPFEHTWSLAIEEQFYLVWPLLALLALRGPRPRLALGLVAAAFTLASGFALAHAFHSNGNDRAYFGTDTRAAAILAGAVLACALHGRAALAPRAARALDALGALALLGLAVAWVRLDGHDPFLYRGGLWLSEAAALLLVACAAQRDRSLIARLFAFRPLVWAGLISYGLYLVHWPIFAALTPGRFGLTGAPLTAARFAATLALALASFRWLEDPIRRHGLPIPRPALVVPASFAAAAAALLLGPRAPRAHATLAPPAPPPVAAERRALPTDRRLLVVGDSVAATLGERLAPIARDQGVQVFVRGLVECSLLEGVLPARSVHDRPHRGGNCASRWAADIREARPDATLVVLGGVSLGSARIQDRWRWACDAAFDEAYARALTRELLAIRPDAGQIVLVRVPYPVGGWKNPTLDRRTDCVNRILEDVAARVGGAQTLDLAGRLCPSGRCALESDGAPIRPDGLHFQGPGADATARWILSSLDLPHGRPTN